MKIEINTTIDDVLEYFAQINSSMKKEVLNRFTFDEIVNSIEQHLRGENSDFWGWDTSGWRQGSLVRKKIAKMTGIEKEMVKDYESKIRALEHSKKHYKKYYDWYFKVYHADRDLFLSVKKQVGDVEK